MSAERRLGNITLLRDLHPEDVRKIYQLSIEKHFFENALIIKQGEYADSLFFIMEGKAKVYSKCKDGKVSILATLEDDDYFGEHGYLNHRVRTHSVKAMTDLRLLEIDYEILDHVGKASEKFTNFIQAQSYGKSIANLQSQLNSIDSYVKRELFTYSEKSSLVHFEKDQVIFNKGDHADTVYFICSGRVLLEFDKPATPQNTLVIGENHLFGEMGVINKKPRAATARTKTPVSAIAIPGNKFTTAVGRTVGLQKLIGAFEVMYSLPHQESITEEFMSTEGDDSAIFAKYLLGSNRVVICATSVEHPVFTMNIRGHKCDKKFTYVSSGSRQLEVELFENKVVGIKTTGSWPKVNRICELLLHEEPLADATEEAFLSLVA